MMISEARSCVLSGAKKVACSQLSRCLAVVGASTPPPTQRHTSQFTRDCLRSNRQAPVRHYSACREHGDTGWSLLLDGIQQMSGTFQVFVFFCTKVVPKILKQKKLKISDHCCLYWYQYCSVRPSAPSPPVIPAPRSPLNLLLGCPDVPVHSPC